MMIVTRNLTINIDDEQLWWHRQITDLDKRRFTDRVTVMVFVSPENRTFTNLDGGDEIGDQRKGL